MSELFNDKLQEWENFFYNFDRPHGVSEDRPPTNGYDKRPGDPRKTVCVSCTPSR